MAGLTDLVSTVTIFKLEYETLVRDSMRLEILKNYVQNQDFLVRKEILVLLNMEERGEKNVTE